MVLLQKLGLYGVSPPSDEGGGKTAGFDGGKLHLREAFEKRIALRDFGIRTGLDSIQNDGRVTTGPHSRRGLCLFAFSFRRADPSK